MRSTHTIFKVKEIKWYDSIINTCMFYLLKQETKLKYESCSKKRRNEFIYNLNWKMDKNSRNSDIKMKVGQLLD